MQPAQASRLGDGRLHLHHGPIDLIIEAWGDGVEAAYIRASQRFSTVLEELMAEIELLRQPLGNIQPQGRIARRMVGAIRPFTGVFVTPMAAVAGAVADEICAVLAQGDIARAYVNNGGDIAVFLTEGQSLTAMIHDGADAGRVRFKAGDFARGVATSGWRGRSHSLGIADAVSVVARDAARADVAATLIANAVDLPGHGAIKRCAAQDLSPDSDLGERQVTVDVGALDKRETHTALGAGAQVARKMLEDGMIDGAVLFLNGQNTQIGRDAFLHLPE